MPVHRSVEIVDEKGNVVLQLDESGITFTAPNGRKAVLRLDTGTDANTVRLTTQYVPLGTTPIAIVDNIS